MAPARFALAAKKKAAKAKKLAKPKKAAPKKAAPKPKAKAKSSKKVEILQGDWTLPLVALVSLFVGGMIEGRCASYFRRSTTADNHLLA